MSCTSEWWPAYHAAVSSGTNLRLLFCVKTICAAPPGVGPQILRGEDGKGYADTYSNGSANGAGLVRGLTERWQVSGLART